MKIISFSGVDGSGKSTQSKRVAHLLREQDLDVAYTHANRKLLRKDTKGTDGKQYVKKYWPYWVVVGIGIKDLLKIWMFAWQNRKREVLVSDRYVDDIVAKLRFYHAPVLWLERVLLLLTPTPVARIWIDVDSETSFVRDNEYPRSYHEEKHACYNDWFENHPNNDVLRINGALEREAVTQTIMHEIAKRV